MYIVQHIFLTVCISILCIFFLLTFHIVPAVFFLLVICVLLYSVCYAIPAITGAFSVSILGEA